MRWGVRRVLGGGLVMGLVVLEEAGNKRAPAPTSFTLKSLRTEREGGAQEPGRPGTW